MLMHHVFNVKKEAGLHGDSLYLLLLVLFWKRYTIPKIYDKKVSILECIHAQGFRERFLMYGIFKKSWVKKLWSRNTLNKIGLQQSLLPDTWFWWYAIWCSILYNTYAAAASCNCDQERNLFSPIHCWSLTLFITKNNSTNLRHLLRQHPNRSCRTHV